MTFIANWTKPVENYRLVCAKMAFIHVLILLLYCWMTSNKHTHVVPIAAAVDFVFVAGRSIPLALGPKREQRWFRTHPEWSSILRWIAHCSLRHAVRKHKRSYWRRCRLSCAWLFRNGSYPTCLHVQKKFGVYINNAIHFYVSLCFYLKSEVSSRNKFNVCFCWLSK